MGPGFWIKRSIVALVVAVALLFVVQLLKGAAADRAIVYALIWGGISAGLFTLVGYLRFKRNPVCMLPPRAADPDDALK